MTGLDERSIERATAEQQDEWLSLLMWEASNSLAKLTAPPLKAKTIQPCTVCMIFLRSHETVSLCTDCRWLTSVSTLQPVCNEAALSVFLKRDLATHVWENLVFS